MNQGQNLTSELQIHLRESSTSVKVISTVVFISQVWLKLKSCAFLVLFLILLLVFFFKCQPQQKLTFIVSNMFLRISSSV